MLAESYYPYLPTTLSPKKLAKGADMTPCAKCHGSVAVDQLAVSAPLEVSAHELFATLLQGKPALEARHRAGASLHPRRKATLDRLATVLDDIHLAHLLHQDHE